MRNGWVERNWPFVLGVLTIAVAWGALQAQVADHDKEIDKISQVIIDQAVTANDIVSIKSKLALLAEDLDDAVEKNEVQQRLILQVVRDIDRQLR